MGSFRHQEPRCRVNEIPGLMRRTAAAVHANVEAAPVIDGLDYWRRRLGVGPRREIRGRGGDRQAECNNTDRAQQELFHSPISNLAFSLPLVPRSASIRTGPPNCFNIRASIYLIPTSKLSLKRNTRGGSGTNIS